MANRFIVTRTVKKKPYNELVEIYLHTICVYIYAHSCDLVSPISFTLLRFLDPEIWCLVKIRRVAFFPFDDCLFFGFLVKLFQKSLGADQFNEIGFLSVDNLLLAH